MTLPAFLLAYADSNLVWAGCKKYALPAVNARWSLARVLVQTVAQVLLGLALAFALSLLIFQQPVSWILWFSGLLSACQGLVCWGLTAICWNQRVARLKQDTNLPLRLPPARYVVFRWMLGLVYFVVLAVITPLAMLVTVENVYGQLAWKHERQRLVAQGERLTYREILGPEIPAAENAGAAPIFAPFFDYPTDGIIGVLYDEKLRGESSNAVARIKDHLSLPFSHLPSKPKDALQTPLENLADWSAAYRALATSPRKDDPSWGAELRLPPPGDAARDVLAGLSVADGVMVEICAAAARPRSQFAVHWDEGVNVLVPHGQVLKSAQIQLKLRCAAHLAAGETDAAFADATNALNVAELLREEPLLISQLVRMAQGAIAMRTLWQGLAEHRWTDAQLAMFQERLGRVDYLAGLIRAFEGERVCGIAGIDTMIAGAPPFGTAESGPGLRRAVMIIPLGILRENEVALVRMHTARLTDLRADIASGPKGGFAASVRTLVEKERRQRGGGPYFGFGALTTQRREHEGVEPYSPFTILARLMTPALAGAETRATRYQTTVNLAITACALERYRLAHGEFPETLAALSPTFSPKPLPDLMNNEPFRYRRTNDGWFQLYSVGEDGQDDGGVFRAKAKGPIKDWPWPVPTRPEVESLF